MKQKEFKGESSDNKIKKEEKMPFWTKKRRNLASLIGGIILILVGMTGTSISLAQLGINNGWNIPPFIILLLGIFLAYMGASEKW